MMNETNAPETPDARHVMVPKQDHVLSAAGAFGALEKESGNLAQEGQINYVAFMGQPAAADTQDGVAPVASGGMDFFELAGLALVAEGHISETRFRRAVEAVRKAGI